MLVGVSAAINISGGLLTDDAIDFAKMYSAANPNAALFVILPIVYGTVESKTVLKNRRMLEDKLYAPFVCPDCFAI